MNSLPFFANATFLSGNIRHRRFTPVSHEFTYRTSMLLLDLDGIQKTIGPWPLASTNWPAIARFRRKDYCGQGDLKHYVLSQVTKQLGVNLTGKVMLLTNLRYFGTLMNPIAMFYCYDDYAKLRAVVLQVTNTPWREKTLYVLEVKDTGNKQQAEFAKAMHVSPFNPMHMQYRCVYNVPGADVYMHLENIMQGEKHMDATLTLSVQHDFSKVQLAWFYMTRFPESMKTWWRIYSNAFKLFKKRTPIYDHPTKQKTSGVES